MQALQKQQKKVTVGLTSKTTSRFTGSPRFSVIVRVRIQIRVFMEVVLLLDLVVTVESLAHFAEIGPDEPSNIPSFSAVEVSHAPQRVCVKDDAP